mmetsp:Transcript_66889/g.124979  ORF Transcript_66889/g.124979 Transcript_66889/m.124979 type:complete len:80 (-) Transcript_66889:80-319(-)
MEEAVATRRVVQTPSSATGVYSPNKALTGKVATDAASGAANMMVDGNKVKACKERWAKEVEVDMTVMAMIWAQIKLRRR